VDFPRVPLTSDGDPFHKLTAYGDQLKAQHLIATAADGVASCPVKENDKIEGMRCTAPGGGWPLT
jgi:hypothetical protein